MSVTHFAKHSEDSSHWTVEQMLEDALKDCRGERREYRKAIVLWLDDSDGFNPAFTQAGLKMSQVLSLLDVTRAMVLEEMGFGPSRTP